MISTGADSVASELTITAIIAAMKSVFSVAKNGRNFLLDSRSDRFLPGALPGPIAAESL